MPSPLVMANPKFYPGQSLGASPWGASPYRSSFVVSAPASTFDLRDSFSYSSISAMVSAGWIKCGNTADSTYYQISGGMLTLINDGSSISSMCWQSIPSGVTNWRVMTSTAYVGGSLPSIVVEVVAGGHYWRALDAGGGFNSLMLLRDADIVAQIGSYIPEVGVYHLLGMQMRNHQLTVYSEGLVAFSFSVADNDTSLTSVYVNPAWEAHDSYDWVSAAKVDPNGPDFGLGVNPYHTGATPSQNATFTVSIASVNNFAKPVALTAYRYQGQYPTTAKLSPTTVTPSPGGTASSNLTITTNQVVTTSTLYVIVNATSGSVSYQVQVILDVNVPPPDFTISASPGVITLTQHGDGSWTSQNATITLQSTGRFSGTVALSMSSEQFGLSGQFTPSILTLAANGKASSLLQISLNGENATGYYTITIFATSGVTQRSIGISLYLSSSTFTITSDTNPIFVASGAPATIALTLTSINNFTGTITLTPQIYPAVQNGPVLSMTQTTPTLAADQVTTVNLTVSVRVDTPLQTYQATIFAQGGHWSGSTISVSLTIYPAPHSFAPGVSPGTWAKYSIEISGYSQYSLSVELTILKVDATNVTYKIDSYVDQAYENSTNAWLNVYFGTYTNPILPLFLIASNLAIGDPVYPGVPTAIHIQNQQTQTVAGTSRTVNTASSTPSISGLQITAAWDTSTGMLASLDATVPINGTTVNAHYRLTGTNAWAPPPKLSLSITSQSRATLNTPLKFTSTISGGTPPYSYNWYFGDGTTSTEADPTHSYLRSGNYTVTLQIMDGNGNVESSSTRIAVSSPLPPQTVSSKPSIIIASWPTIALGIYLAYACMLAILIVRQELAGRRRNSTANAANSSSSPAPT